MGNRIDELNRSMVILSHYENLEMLKYQALEYHEQYKLAWEKIDDPTSDNRLNGVDSVLLEFSHQ